MSRDSENRRASGLDTPSSPLSPYSIAIFDTCALMSTKDILETTIKNNVIAVVPFTVLLELDDLKHSRIDETRQMAMKALRSIEALKGEPLVFMENPKVMEEKMTGIDMSIRDDKILKCALRVHEHMSLQKRTIWFVTNDVALRLKATTWGTSIIAVESQKFVSVMLSEITMKAGDLEKLRICLTQPQLQFENTIVPAAGKVEKPSTLTPKISLLEQPVKPASPPPNRGGGGHDAVPPIDMRASVNKESLQDQFRRVETTIRSLTNGGVPPVSSSGVGSTATSGETSHLSMLGRLSDLTQRFHSSASLYTDQIAPHNKFRFRELLNRLEVFVRQVRQFSSSCSSTDSSTSPSHSAASSNSLEDSIKPLLEVFLWQIMLLVNSYLNLAIPF